MLNATALQSVFSFLASAEPTVVQAISTAKASGISLSSLLPSSLSEFATEADTAHTLFQSLLPLFSSLTAAKAPAKS